MRLHLSCRLCWDFELVGIGSDDDDDDSNHDEVDDPNLDSGVALASLWLNQESCHCFDIQSISHGEFVEEDDDDSEVDDEDEDEDEVIQLLTQRRIASPPLLTLH